MKPGQQGGAEPSEQTARAPGGTTMVVLLGESDPPPELELHAASAAHPAVRANAKPSILRSAIADPVLPDEGSILSPSPRRRQSRSMERSPWRLETYEELGSTSDLCAARAAAGEPDGLAVLALRQTRARGSRGREWQAPLGNLSLSVLWRDAGPLADIGWVPLLAGVALAEAISPLLADPGRLALKWPNDVTLDGAKLAGVLIETTAAGDRADTLVIGIGVNLAIAPDVPGRVVAALSGTLAAAPSPGAFAPRLLDRLWDRRGSAREAIRTAWLGRAHPVGTPLAVTLAGERLSGVFAGLDSGGRLLLDVGAERRAIGAGEILLGGPAPRAVA